MRLWIHFAKENPMRYLSHLDLMRAWQRAIRRARLPVAYSAGFNPHPKMSFASALAVGVTSDAEYLDIELQEDVGDEELTRLQTALPTGLPIMNWRVVPQATPALMSLISVTQWVLPIEGGDVSRMQSHIAEILSALSLPIVRKGKKGTKVVDVRPLILKLTVDHKQQQLAMLLASGGDGGVKPRELLALLNLSTLEYRLHRTALLINCGQCLQPPMAVSLNEKEVSINAEEDCYQL